jgi:hypothetical protein
MTVMHLRRSSENHGIIHVYNCIIYIYTYIIIVYIYLCKYIVIQYYNDIHNGIYVFVIYLLHQHRCQCRGLWTWWMATNGPWRHPMGIQTSRYIRAMYPTGDIQTIQTQQISNRYDSFIGDIETLSSPIDTTDTTVLVMWNKSPFAMGHLPSGKKKTFSVDDHDNLMWNGDITWCN